jgi:hypothetical protein
VLEYARPATAIVLPAMLNGAAITDTSEAGRVEVKGYKRITYLRTKAVNCICASDLVIPGRIWLKGLATRLWENSIRPVLRSPYDTVA